MSQKYCEEYLDTIQAETAEIGQPMIAEPSALTKLSCMDYMDDCIAKMISLQAASQPTAAQADYLYEYKIRRR